MSLFTYAIAKIEVANEGCRIIIFLYKEIVIRIILVEFAEIPL